MLLNLHHHEKKYIKTKTGERWELVLYDHRQDGTVAVGGIGNLAR